MYVFTPAKAWNANLSCFTDCTKHTPASTFIHRQQRIPILNFYTNKTEQHLQT